LQLLADRCEGNLLAAKQDLDKLALLAEQQPIGSEQVMASVANNARYTTFELIDTALSGNGPKVVRMLRQLQAEGVAPLILVSTIYREARQLLKMSVAVASGQSVADVVRDFRIWSSRSRLISGALQRIPPKVWQSLVNRCAHLDLLSKGKAEGNVWDELLTCLLLMGGKPLWKKVI
jgi:DNA polymerase-3 subunit delta